MKINTMVELFQGAVPAELGAKRWTTGHAELDDRGATAVVIPYGDLILGEETAALRRHVERVLDQRYSRIELDLTNLGRVDPAGRGLLVYLERLARARDSRIYLSHLPRNASDLPALIAICRAYGGDAVDPTHQTF